MRKIVNELMIERTDVKNKFAKLDTAITNYERLGISGEHVKLMSEQWVAMKRYIEVLDNRIKDLQK